MATPKQNVYSRARAHRVQRHQVPQGLPWQRGWGEAEEATGGPVHQRAEGRKAVRRVGRVPGRNLAEGNTASDDCGTHDGSTTPIKSAVVGDRVGSIFNNADAHIDVMNAHAS